jgi:parallel beta-helix repeat protein
MKKFYRKMFLRLGLLLLLAAPQSSVFGQGALTPPAAPAPTMLTLNQIEPRTPISSLPYTITNPGSYYLAGNLTGIAGSDGIVIKTNDVTLDLKGFTLRGVAGSDNGINVLNPVRNLAIRNGVVETWGAYGVNAVNGNSGELERLRASNCSSLGLVVGDNWTVLGCSASGNTYQGIYVGNNCTIKDCNAKNNGNAGIVAGGLNCVISGCVASGSLGGFSLASYSIIEDCVATGNTNGISVLTACTIKNCNTCGNTNDGIIMLGQDCQVVGNTASGNGKYGIEIFGYPDRVDDNVVSDNASYGINADNLNVTNCITRNFSAGPGYGGFPGNKDYAPIQSPTNTVASPWANFQ